MKVLIVRPTGAPDDDARALTQAGLDVTWDPYLDVSACTDAGAATRAHRLLEALDAPTAWLILTSAAGARALEELLGHAAVATAINRARGSGARFAAVGPASAIAIQRLGAGHVHVPTRTHTASALLDLLRHEDPATAVLPRSSVGDGLTPDTLAARGWSVVSEVVYATGPVADRPATADGLARGHFDALVLRSPSAARAVMTATGGIPTSTVVIAGGPTTALAAQRLGLAVARVAADSRARGIADAVMAALADSASEAPPQAQPAAH